ncbi:MAG: hypothetical protein ABH854_05315 [Candidatus Diapherotrites archaeon]|nr:hypothetical protein [Candidatus Micrarchaeota archaeon]MBU1939885.1 hypothetical protein [Candidatus Micrarchaeota archaeon]
MKGKLALAIVCLVLMSGCVEVLDALEEIVEEADDNANIGTDILTYIKSDLQSIGIDVTNVRSDGGEISVSYNQADEFTEEGIYTVWANIYKICLENADRDSGVNSLKIIANFSDGESFTAATTPEHAAGFINEEINVIDFLLDVDVVYNENLQE